MFDCAKFILDIAERWQTLIAAIIAIAAAWWTIATMKSQISQEAQRHNDLLRRREFSARARIPDALSELCRFTEHCMKYRDGRDEERPLRVTDAIEVLKNAIEHIGTQPAEKVFDLVSFYQVHNARLFSSRRRRDGIERADGFYDTVRLRFLIDRLYEYARNESDSVSEEPTQENMISALKAAVGLAEYAGAGDKYADVLEIIEKRHRLIN